MVKRKSIIAVIGPGNYLLAYLGHCSTAGLLLSGPSRALLAEQKAY